MHVLVSSLHNHLFLFVCFWDEGRRGLLTLSLSHSLTSSFIFIDRYKYMRNNSQIYSVVLFVVVVVDEENNRRSKKLHQKSNIFIFVSCFSLLLAFEMCGI